MTARSAPALIVHQCRYELRALCRDRQAGLTTVLMPILGDLITEGHPAGPGRPWLGLTTDEGSGRLVVNRVTSGSPAEKAGIQRGNIIVGINGETPTSLNDFYKKLWSKGEAGAVVALDVMQNNAVRRIEVKSSNRLQHLKLNSTF